TRSTIAGRDRDLIFVGRLVSEKGLDLLLEALARLGARGWRPQLTVIGSGAQHSAMEEMTARLDLRDQVKFAGAKSPSEIAEALNRHKILVAPSRYDEPFGVVALEGIGCGCAVIGSNGGGLPEAIGPCGITFPNGDVDALAKAIEKLLREPDERHRLAENAATHLSQFQPATIA